MWLILILGAVASRNAEPRDQKLTHGEDFDGYTFTRFDGTKITV